jgi:hypothetical protein
MLTELFATTHSGGRPPPKCARVPGRRNRLSQRCFFLWGMLARVCVLVGRVTPIRVLRAHTGSAGDPLVMMARLRQSLVRTEDGPQEGPVGAEGSCSCISPTRSNGATLWVWQRRKRGRMVEHGQGPAAALAPHCTPQLSHSKGGGAKH